MSSSSCERCTTIYNAAPSISSQDRRRLRSPGYGSVNQSQIIDIVNKLDKEILILENKRKIARSLLAPVRRLPVEVLSHIFALYGGICPNVIDQGMEPNQVQLAGLTPMAVCAHWREVAKSCSPLWSGIKIDIEDKEGIETLAAPLKWCLEHAGAAVPLDIQFYAWTPDYYYDSPALLDIVKMLVSRASRWRHVLFNTDHTLMVDFPLLSLLLETPLPFLESLHLMNWGDAKAELALFKNAGPKFRKLSFRRAFPSDTTGGIKEVLPWMQIKELFLEFYGNEGEDSDSDSDSSSKGATSGIFNILAICPNVETVSYWFREVPPRIPLQASTTVSSLSVDIESKDGNIFGALIDSSHFPALEQLSVKFPSYPSYPKKITWPEKNVLDFLLRSQCCLTSLHIENAAISDTNLIDILTHTPDLHHFSFHQTPLKPDTSIWGSKRAMLSWRQYSPSWQDSPSMAFIRRLHASPGSKEKPLKTLVPKLQHLSLKVFGDWWDDDKLFVRVINSRWIRGSGGLKSVELKVWGHGVNEAAYRQLKGLGQGLRVEVFGEQ